MKSPKKMSKKWFKYYDENGDTLKSKECCLSSPSGNPPYTTLTLLPPEGDENGGVMINLKKLKKANLKQFGIKEVHW